LSCRNGRRRCSFAASHWKCAAGCSM
jgi:hypothetical protein